jgi:hypothetical protein
MSERFRNSEFQCSKNRNSQFLVLVFSLFQRIETFEKCIILFKVKESENFNPPDHHREPQEYVEYFEELNLSLTPRLRKGGVFQRSRVKNEPPLMQAPGRP